MKNLKHKDHNYILAEKGFRKEINLHEKKVNQRKNRGKVFDENVDDLINRLLRLAGEE